MWKRSIVLLTVILFCLCGEMSVAFATETAQDYYARGYVHGQAGDLGGAIADYTKAIELNPLYADAYYARGYVYSQTKNFTAAVIDYTKDIEIKPQDGKAYFARANILDDQGNFTLAIADYAKLIELNPQDASAYNSRGVSYGKKGDFVQAIADYDKAIELDPKFVRPYYNRGLAKSLMGKDDEALADYSEALGMDAYSADALNNRGIIYIKKGNYEAAIDDFSKAIKLFPIETNPDHTPPYLGRAEAYIADGQYDLAIEDSTKIIDLYPGYADPYRLRARAYYFKKDTDRAWADVNTIRKLGKGVPMDFLLDLGSVTPDDDELEKAGMALFVPAGWQLFMKASDVQEDLFGSLKVQSYSYVSPDRKAHIVAALPVAIPDGAFKRVLEDIRSSGHGVLEDKIILLGRPCSVFTRIEPGEDRRKMVSYHFYKNGRAYAVALSVLEADYGLYKSAFDKVVKKLETFSPLVDGRAFYIDQDIDQDVEDASKKSSSSSGKKGKKGSSGTHPKKTK